MTIPNKEMQANAERGLKLRREYGRGGTAVGVARARDIMNAKDLSDRTIKRMYSYFSRHESNYAEHYGEKETDGGPNAFTIAWLLWGGDAGFRWSERLVEQMDRSYQKRPYPNEHNARITEPDQYQGFRRMNDELGNGIHVILGLIDGQSEIQSIRFDKTKWTVEQSQAWLADEGYEPLEFEPAIEEKEMTNEVTEKVEEQIEISDNDESRFIEEVQHRSITLGRNVLDEESRTIEMSVSSEKPVDRSFGVEILDHTRESMDLEFLNSGNAPLLLDHEMEKQIGIIESVKLDEQEKKLRAIVRFGRGTLASEVFNDVVDGIRKNVSIGYTVKKMKKEEGGSYRVIDYKIHEVSIVSIPADSDVGVNRALDDVTVVEGHCDEVVTDVQSDSSDSIRNNVNLNPKEENIMSDLDIKAVEAEAKKSAQLDAAKMIELGARHNQVEMAQNAIAQGRSIEDFRSELLDTVGSKAAVQPQNIGMSEKEIRKFSIVKAVRALANPHDRKAQEDAAFEFECSRATGRNTQGIIVPADVLNSYKRDLNSTDEAALFADDFRGGDFVDVLRNKSSVMAAGATVLSGLSGDVKIPKKATAASASWVGEGSAVSESEMTATAITMSPKTVGAFTDVTTQLLAQSSLDIENLIREDLAQAIAIAMDKAALEGTGSNGQPTGILNVTGVNQVTNFAAATPTFAECVSLETAVSEDNALMGNLAYILPSSMYGALKTTEKASGTAQFVVEPQGTINGYNAIVSNQATAGNLYYGNFSDVLVGLFGGLELVVDPYSNAPSGLIRITARQMMDVAVRHAQSFAFGNDG
jgi:HK97 family phage major capsid protein/HK97 family phage prohead protease